MTAVCYIYSLTTYRIWSRISQQIDGIAFGTNCAIILAYLVLFSCVGDPSDTCQSMITETRLCNYK